MWFDIYETGVTIIIDLDRNRAYVDCECTDHQMSSSMLMELASVVELLEDNLHVFKEILGGK